MSDVIKLVQGDTLPEIFLTLTNETTGAAINVSGASVSIAVKFRLAGATTTLSTIPCTKTDAANGIVSFDFGNGELVGIDPGMYEGEIAVTTGSDVQTVYDLLRFRVREQFA